MWYLGYPDQGLVRNDKAVSLAQQSAHPFSLGYALSCAAWVHQFRRERRAAQERAEATITLAGSAPDGLNLLSLFCHFGRAPSLKPDLA
jgi:hypothetical protein